MKSLRDIIMSCSVGSALHTIAYRYFLRKKLPKGHCGKGSFIRPPSWINKGGLEKIFIGDDSHISCDCVLFCTGGNLIIKNHVAISVGLTVVTGNHLRSVGMWFTESEAKLNEGKDVVIEDDVWIGANVTLLSGVQIGRGATVGAGAVCVKNVPPYAIVMGNPAKVVGFNFTPEQIIEHEKVLYSESERLPLEVLQKNYKKHLLDRASDIKTFLK